MHPCLDGVAVVTLQTPLCALFGIDVPIVQAPIGSWPELSAAVSNAGGLGMLGLSWDDPSEVHRLIRETSNLTAAPFGMNLKLDEDQHERLEAGLEEGVRVVSLFLGTTCGRRRLRRPGAPGGCTRHADGWECTGSSTRRRLRWR